MTKNTKAPPCIVDWNGVVPSSPGHSKAVVISKINSPFFYGDIVDETSVYQSTNGEEFISSEIRQYISAVGILHSKVEGLRNKPDIY